ncbi:MAG: hypothetical protein ACRDPO_38785 [Streptosporangiaceae bacterium]
MPNGKNDADLNGVSCRSAHLCVAVGAIKAVPPTGDDYVPVADHWNGSAWTQARPPAGARTGNLAAVACSDTTAGTAVGSSAKGGGAPRPLADHWNGSAWKIQPVPVPAAGGGQLTAVACPAADACRAVGSDNKGPFSEVWNGSRWRAQAPSTVSGEPSAGLDAVSCVSATDCEAAGDAGVKEGPSPGASPALGRPGRRARRDTRAPASIMACAGRDHRWGW